MQSLDHVSSAADPAIAILRPGDPSGDARCVLLWAQRARSSRAANLAVEIGNDLDLPVIVAFCLVPAFPKATLRAYHFMAEGLRDLPDGFARRGIGWHLVVGEPDTELPALVEDLGAAALVTDMNPLSIGRRWRARVARAIDVPMIAVDSDVIVPSALFQKEEYAPRTIRGKLAKQLDRYLVPVPDIHPARVSKHRRGPDPLRAIAGLDLDADVGPAPDLRGGSSVAHERLRRFVAERLDRYHEDRQRADIEAGSGLSPWLHYGQVSPVEIAVAVHESDAPAAAKDAFLDELFTQRELAINFAWRNPHYDTWAGLPDWGRATLAKHAKDPRDETYTRGEFEQSRTHDALWNAAMTQMREEGTMPNRLRMYWAKQILRWSANPENAWRTAVYLNNKYFVDGRDANSYANIAWCIGGRHDRPFGPEKDVFGLVRPMGMGAMKRTFDVRAYIDGITARWGDGTECT